MTSIQIAGLLVLVAAFMLLLWRIKHVLLSRTIGCGSTRVTIIVTAQGNPAELEQSVKGLLRLISECEMNPGTEIVIKNSGMNSQTADMAKILEREYEAVSILE